MADVKVYAMLVSAPRAWGVERADNGSTQVRAVAVAKSGAEFRRILAAHGYDASVRDYNHSGGQTWSAREVKAATLQPGTVFHEVSARSGIHAYRAAPLEEAMMADADLAPLRPGRSFCSDVSSGACQAPAGYRTGSGTASASGVRRADLLTCGYCGEPVCRECSSEVDGKPVCLSHDETELLWWMGLA